MIRRLLVQILAPGKVELHVEVSLSEILNPTLLISEGPAMSWQLVQGVPCLLSRLGLAPAAERTKASRDVLSRNVRLQCPHTCVGMCFKYDENSSQPLDVTFTRCDLELKLMCAKFKVTP